METVVSNDSTPASSDPGADEDSTTWQVPVNFIRIPVSTYRIVAPGVADATSCITNPSYRQPLKIVGPDPTAPGMSTWKNAMGLRFAVNASFFNPRPQSADQPDPTNPHSWTCTKVYGLTYGGGTKLADDGLIIASRQTSGAPSTQQLSVASLLFFLDSAGNQTAAIQNSPVFSRGSIPSNLSVAVSGSRLVENGAYVGDEIAGPQPRCPFPRTAAGLNIDATILTIVVVNIGDNNKSCSYEATENGFTLRGLAEFMISNGVRTAINLDGGGSSQFYWSDAGHTIQSKPSDDVPSATKSQYRPVANVLGIE